MLLLSCCQALYTSSRPVYRLPTTRASCARLARWLRLEVELGLAETRGLSCVRRAVAIAVVGRASPDPLAGDAGGRGAVAPLFDARWEPLLIAGGGVVLLALAAWPGARGGSRICRGPPKR